MAANPTGVGDFFSFSVWAHFLSRANAQKVLFGNLLEHLNLPHFNHYMFKRNMLRFLGRLVWCGVGGWYVYRGVVRCTVAVFGMVWYGEVCRGVVWYGV